MIYTFTISGKKRFTADPVTARRLVTLSDLEDITDDLVITMDGPAPPKWVQVDLDYTDFAAAATTGTATVYALPAGGVIHGVFIKHSEAFSGGSLSSYTISVGISGSATKYAGAFNVFQAVADTTFQLSTTAGMENFGAATNIIATATGSHNTDTATAGAVSIYLLVSTVFEES
jgi:hypothetical protein